MKVVYTCVHLCVAVYECWNTLFCMGSHVNVFLYVCSGVCVFVLMYLLPF